MEDSAMCKKDYSNPVWRLILPYKDAAKQCPECSVLFYSDEISKDRFHFIHVLLHAKEYSCSSRVACRNPLRVYGILKNEAARLPKAT
jgi:hypothetical protein